MGLSPTGLFHQAAWEYLLSYKVLLVSMRLLQIAAIIAKFMIFNVPVEIFSSKILRRESGVFHDEQFTFKVSVVGDPACGKTSTILKYTDSAFRRTYLPTIGVNITKKKIKERNDITLILWDIAGHLKFSQMRKTFYEGTKAILLIYDLTREDTFENVQGWFNDIRKNIPHETTSNLLKQIKALLKYAGLK